MLTETAEKIAQEILKGVFDVFESVLSTTFTYELSAPVEADLATLQRNLDRCAFVMRGALPAGGGFALLLAVEDALRMASLISGAASESLGEEQMATLREVAEPCLGSGIAGLLEQNGLNVEQPTDVTCEIIASDVADNLLNALSPPLTVVEVAFSAGETFVSAPAVLLLSDQLARLVPDETQSELRRLAQELAGKPQLSESEMSDILSGFSPEKAREAAAAAVDTARLERSPTNLDMVLDIRLVATARLGRIEMPIGEILSLGPGSIIDVGHLVDEPVELLVNNKLIARGDVVVVDERFGLRITEIVSAKERIEIMH